MVRGREQKSTTGFHCTERKRREEKRSSDGRALSADDVRLNGGHQILDLHVLQRVNGSEEEGFHVSARNSLHHGVYRGITYKEREMDHATASPTTCWKKKMDLCRKIIYTHQVPESPHCLARASRSSPWTFFPI